MQLNQLRDIVLVFIGGAVGASLRYLVESLGLFTFGVSLANILGCVGLGMAITYVKMCAISNFWYKPLIQTGFFGAFTSYASLSLFFYINIDNSFKAFCWFLVLLIFYVLLFLCGVFLAKWLLKYKNS